MKKAEEARSRYIPTEKERLAAEREASRERSKRAAVDLEAYDDAEKRLESAREVLGSAGAALDEPSFNLMRILERRPGTFLNLWRHEIVLSRSFNKTLHELQRLQAARTGEHVAPPSVVDVNVNLPDPSMPVGDADESDGTPE